MTQRLKHRWSVGNNYLSGITAGRWWTLLRENRFDIDAVYWHRAAFVTMFSVLNSMWSAIEQLRFAKKIDAVEITKPPLFVLGHWRSGTTHLHNLLALDEEQFAFPNTYQVVSPFTFLSTEAVNTRMFSWLVPKTRPMDNMSLSFASPQEDELALCLESLRSVYLTITFPRRERHYARFLTFQDADPADTRRWQDALLWFVKKVTHKYDRAILLKSPSHTARIKLILEVFPDARFVHIHRDPYTVFLSSQRYWDTAAWYTYLQRPDREFVDDQIIGRYRNLYDAYFAERDLIAADHLHEVSYQDVERDPVGQVAGIYDALALPGFENVEPKLRAYMNSIKDYQKNKHSELPDNLRQRVAEQWRRSFDEWGYSI